MIKINILNKNIEKTYKKGTSLLEIANDLKIEAYVAKVNKRLRELTYIPKKDTNIEFLDLKSKDVEGIYEASLRYLISYAIYRLYPKSTITFKYSISQSIFASIDNITITDEILNTIKKEMDILIEKDYKIQRVLLSIEDINTIYEDQNFLEKTDILRFRESDYVNSYECNGFYNYCYSLMVPSTSFLKNYKLLPYEKGFLIQYPRANNNGLIPEFDDDKIYAQTLKKASQWSQLLHAESISKLNQYALSPNNMRDLVNMCETKHSNTLYELGRKILENKDVKIIAIAGPSSSGKTTFANRLRIELKTQKIEPLLISIDDFYNKPDDAPKDEFGKPDLEHINSLDIELFNNTLLSLVKGLDTSLPKYDFKSSTRSFLDPIKLDDNQVIIIEGIHALNDILTSKINRKLIYKIFISPQIQIQIDNHNPISFTDLRLLRRIVRDFKHRNASVGDTLDMWPSVRRGEFKWIYPHQENVDFVYNTELTYEFNVLKKHALPLLQAIPRDSKYFIQSNKLVKFLRYFINIPDDIVPCNSILREFIGGSSYN